jgi:hypothetical protein
MYIYIYTFIHIYVSIRIYKSKTFGVAVVVLLRRRDDQDRRLFVDLQRQSTAVISQRDYSTHAISQHDQRLAAYQKESANAHDRRRVRLVEDVLF